MAPDDLNAPLGQAKPKGLLKVKLPIPQLLVGFLCLTGVLVFAWAALVNDPLGGEPTATVPMAARMPAKGGGDRDPSRFERPGAASDAQAAATARNPQPPQQQAATPPDGSRTVTIIDGSSGKREDVVIPGSAAPGPAQSVGSGSPAPVGSRSDADPSLIEKSRHGGIPKIGPDGKRPSNAYARPRPIPEARKDWPRVALIVGGIGISASGTADAFAKLPAAVTFALTPYGADLPRLAENARADNHEVLLQLPMEPFDYPDNDPGPQTLLASLPPDQNIDRLHWMMSRFQGFVGVTSYMGSKFTAAESAISPVLRDISKRGLIYVDDGASARSIAGQIAGSTNLPFAKADVVLDAVPTPVEIDRALIRLEMLARDHGVAVGIATAQPATIARLASWAKKIEGRGISLVPVSMITSKARSS